MSKIRVVIRLLAALALVTAGLGASGQAPSLGLATEPNQTLYAPGDVLRTKFSITATALHEPSDVYVGILLPDQRTTLFVSSLSPLQWSQADLRMNAAAFVPLQSARQIGVGTTEFPTPLQVNIPATIDPGEYSLLFALTRTGTLADGSVDAGDLMAYLATPVVVQPFPEQATARYAPFKPLMAQSLATGVLYVTGSQQVRSAALVEAERQLNAMLRWRPDVVARLQNSGALIGVFAETEGVCSLPYFSDLTGQPNCDSLGGLGGVPGREASGCSERSLLQLASDPFRRGTPAGENTCLHEIAHLIMNVGLTDAERQRIRSEYARALASGVWGSDYLTLSVDEYFAEISQAYFCANPQIPVFNHMQGVNCPSSLQAHDPRSYALVDSIYGESVDLR